MVLKHHYLLDPYVILKRGLHKGLKRMYRSHILWQVDEKNKDLFGNSHTFVDRRNHFAKIDFNDHYKG
jgi:hypothetical protein